MGFRIFVILRGILTHGRRPGANERSVSLLGEPLMTRSAESRRLRLRTRILPLAPEIRKPFMGFRFFIIPSRPTRII